MEVVCQMLSIKPKKVPETVGSNKKTEDYWPASQLLLGDSSFLTKLKDYDKDNIPQSVISTILPYFDHPDFDSENVRLSSKAAHGLCLWIRAIEFYYRQETNTRG